MFRFLRIFVPVLLLALLVAGALAWRRSPDPFYALQERVQRQHFQEYDALITAAGRRYRVDPMLVKAVVWRESRFNAGMTGRSGERGLMQVTDAAGQDWARAEKLETFQPTDLFDPKVNLQAGAWYVSKAAEHWKAQDDPIPFTLAEFNAGRRRVDRWVATAKQTEPVNAASFLRAMDFPNTRKYINEVTGRYHYYQQRGRM